MWTRKRKIILVIAILFSVWFLWYFKFAGHHVTLQTSNVPQDFWGITFSKKYATELGLEWRDAYLAMLDDLHIKNIRLPVYWDEVEQSQGEFDFSDYDWMLQEGKTRDVSFILNVGRRLPRWPECHQPPWVETLAAEHVDARHIIAVQAMIDHFKSYDSIRYWQIENEYFFPWFGLCPKANPELLRQEVDYLRTQDSRPLVLTDSGELNSWREAAKYSDVLGITIYRVVWSKYFGYFRYPWPAALYRTKAAIARKSPDTMIVAELQAEPWPAHFSSVTAITREESAISFDLRQFETNAEIARRTGFQQAYFWGAEWWYWLKEHGDVSMWNKAKEIINAGKN